MLKITKDYIDQMNSSIGDKKKLIPYIVGNSVLDVGCGSGELMKAISTNNPFRNVVGMDLAPDNYKDSTSSFEVIKGDARFIDFYIEYGEVDTIIFSSVLHEVYSYNEYSEEDVFRAIQGAYNVLPPGGRIIIRDGVKTEGNPNVNITFNSELDLEKLEKFQKDFIAREIKFSVSKNQSVDISMDDAMEFLYTITWGDEAYEREVQEQYGLFTPKDYISKIRRKTGLGLVTYNHYLQEGYNHYLSKKVTLFDEEGRKTRLPDSNLLMVFQK